MKGITYGDIEEMPSDERIWYLNRLGRQLEKELKKMKGK
jgi:hypothetical protein